MTDLATTELSLAALELTKLEACVELMLFAAYADGVVDAPERALFESHVERATHGQVRPEIARSVIASIEAEVQRAEPALRVRRIAEQLPDAKLRRAALSLAIAVATADGKLTPEERRFLEQAAAAFELSKEDAAKLLDRAS